MAQAIGSFIDRIQLGDDETHQIAIGSSAYGVCNTAADTAAKTVNIPGFTLNTGTTIHVKFTNTNTASNPTLNVSSTGAVSIVFYDSIIANTVLTLTYDGTSWIQDYIATDYAPLNSPNFTGIPTAPTAATGTNTTQIATTAFVQNTLGYTDAMVFKGTIGANGTINTTATPPEELPATHRAGDTYRVITAGTYADMYCEVGTLIICIADGTIASDADWTSVETNEDGAVIGPSSSTADHIVTFSGTSGRIIQDSGFTIETSVPASALFTDQKVNITLKNTTTANQYIYLLGTITTPTSTASAQEAYSSTSLYVNGENQGKLELVLGNAIKTTSTGGQFGQLALYSIGTNGTYLKSEANDTDWYTATLPAKTGTLVMLKDNSGPISTTATAIAIYSDTTGTLDNSLATIDASGNITATSFIGDLIGDVTGDITGTASNVTGTIAVANGGTGTTSFTDSCVIVPSTTDGTQVFASTGLKVLGITTDDITLSPYTAGQAMTISSTTGTMTISTSTAAMTLSTTSGNMNLSSGGTISITSASTKSTTITSGHTLSLLSGNLQDISLTSAKDIVLTNDTTTIKLISTSLQPNTNQGAGLGSATNRWSNLYIGSADSYGDAYTPVYWNSGVPAAVTPVQYVSFSITNGNEGVELVHAAFTANSYVLQIVVDTGEQYLSSPIEWTSATGTITLSCAAVTGTVSGYIVVSRGDTLSSVTATQQAASI